MFDYLLIAISCACLLHKGLGDDGCYQAVLARRQVFHVPAGNSLTLSCSVRHCGGNWTGTWQWKNTTDESLVQDTARLRLTEVAVSANETQLLLQMTSVNQSDDGSYGCRVTWGEGETDQGHWVVVNVTAAVPPQRKSLHRFLICTSALLWLPIILGLACCLRSKFTRQPLPRAEFTYAAVRRDQPQSAPRPPPRRLAPQRVDLSPHEGAAPVNSQPKAEVVYADISQDSLMQQEATREPAQSTVYSSLKFP